MASAQTLKSTSVRDVDVKFQVDQDMVTQVCSLVTKKKRNLEKRKQKLEELSKRKQQGENLSSGQIEALCALEGVNDSIAIVQSISDQIAQLFQAQAKWIKKEKKNNMASKLHQLQAKETTETDHDNIFHEVVNTPQEVQSNTPSECPGCLEKKEIPPDYLEDNLSAALLKQASIYRLLECFGDESVRHFFRNLDPEKNERCLDILDEANDLLNPISTLDLPLPDGFTLDPLGSSAPVKSTVVLKLLKEGQAHMVKVLTCSNEPMLSDGTTYQKFASMCDALTGENIFMEWIPVSPDVPLVSPSKRSTQSSSSHKDAPIVSRPFNSESTDIHLSTNTNQRSAEVFGGVESMLSNLRTPFQFMQIDTPIYKDHAVTTAAQNCHDAPPGLEAWCSASQQNDCLPDPTFVESCNDAESAVHSEYVSTVETDAAVNVAPTSNTNFSWADRVRKVGYEESKPAVVSNEPTENRRATSGGNYGSRQMNGYSQRDNGYNSQSGGYSQRENGYGNQMGGYSADRRRGGGSTNHRYQRGSFQQGFGNRRGQFQ